MRRPALLALALTLGWCLACSGVDIEPRGTRWGGRVEYRRYSVSLEDPFNPVDRSGDTIGANLIMASIYWRL